MVHQPQKDKPVGFLQDDDGNKSSMRLMAFLSLFAAIVFSGAIFWKANTSESARLTLLQKEIAKEQPNPELLNTLKSINESDNKTNNGTDGISIIWAFLTAAFGGKFAQKWCELQPKKNDEKDNETQSQTDTTAGTGP